MMLYSSAETAFDGGAGQQSTVTDSVLSDSNSYRPFKLVDSIVVRRIAEEMEALEEQNKDEEGEPPYPSSTPPPNTHLSQNPSLSSVLSPRHYAVRIQLLDMTEE